MKAAAKRAATPTAADDPDAVYEVRLTGRQIEAACQLIDLAVRNGGLTVSAIALNVADAISAPLKIARARGAKN